MSTVPALYRHLVDDAAMFPPGELPLTEAVPAHRAHRAAPYADLVGTFICTDTDLMKVAEAATDPLRLSVVITGGAGAIEPAVLWARRSPDVDLTAVEIRLRLAEDMSWNAERVVRVCSELLDDEQAYVETGMDGSWERSLDLLAEHGYHAKLRTGGLEADLFPTEQQVATYIAACLDREVAFKCTAGLHNAVRHTSADTGFEHHGFLNVLLATRASLDGASLDDVAAVLAERDGTALAARARELSEMQVVGTRRWFHSFGSCSISEPLDDLTALNLMEEL